MRNVFFRLITIVVLFPLSVFAEQNWVAKSNVYSTQVMQVMGQFSPEQASFLGLTEYDGFVSDLGSDVFKKKLDAYHILLTQLQKSFDEESDARVRQDIKILIKSIEQSIEGEELTDKYYVRWENLPQLYFESIAILLSEQVSPERRSKASERLERYLGLYSGSTSLSDQAKALFKNSRSSEKIAPFKEEIEFALQAYPTYIEGIKELFAQYEIKDAEVALKELEGQLTEYMDWTKKTVLPIAREDFVVPEEIYGYRLRSAGVDISPETLMEKAKVEFYETRAAMQALAPQVAKRLDIDSDDYRDVIKALKKNSIKDDELQQLYKNVNTQIEEIVREHQIVTLPSTQLAMRLSTEAEAAAQPAPHMQPPPLLNNSGEQGVFILPVSLSKESQDKYDDFNFSAATWTLSAHEARPGHELQFASMLKSGVSQARTVFAFNSVNVEGWALYAEAEMVPFEPIEGQLIAMQHRLLRAARAFLDPMLNLGLMKVEQATEILKNEVVLSSAMIKQEIDRYTYRNPGQATSYYYGYTRLLDMRITAELLLGERFNRMKFNDFVLGQGLLPPDLVAEAIMAQFIPSQLE